MKTKRIEFIKSAWAEACSEWKTKIENEFTNIDFSNDVLEVGVWYKDTERDYKRLVFITDNSGINNYKGYGFNNDRAWCDDILGFSLDDYQLTKATTEEVETALIKEAKKRGFKEGAACISVAFPLDGIKTIENSIIEWHGNKALFIGNGMQITIFEKGKWATIITKKKMTVSDVEKELGYDKERIK